MKMYRENFGFNNFNKKKMLLIFSICIFFFVCFLSVGFSAFETSLVMKDVTALVKYNTKVLVSNITVKSVTNAVASNTDYNYNKIYGDILLQNETSSITYEIEIVNLGNTKAGIASLTGLNENFKYTLEGYTIGDPIEEDGAYTLGATMKILITIEYADGVTPSSEKQPFYIDFDFRNFHKVTYHGVPGEEEHPSEIMDGFDLVINTELTDIARMKITEDTVFLTYGEDYFYDETTHQLTIKEVVGDLLLSYRDIAYLVNLSSNTAYFKESAYKKLIKNIEFVDYVDLTNAVKSYDLADDAEDPASIKGWIEVNTVDNDGTYNLYIGSVYDIYTKNFENAFRSMTGVRNINFDNLNTSESVSFNYTFYETDVTYLNLETFNTSSAITMINTFGEMDQLLTLDVSNFNTSNVTTMWSMFGGATQLTELDISTFNTSNVATMAYMFSGMSKLQTINLGENFNTSRATSMESMFSGCTSLQTLDLSTFKTDRLQNAESMFYNCSSLTTLDLTTLNTSNVTNMTNMFYGMSKLTTLDVSTLDTSSATTMSGMFSSCSQITNLDLSNFNTSNVTDMSEMFYKMNAVQSLNTSSFNTSSVTKMNYMFANCMDLTNLDLSNFDTSNVTTMEKMFYNMYALETLDLSSFKTPLVTNMNSLVARCFALTEINFSQATFATVYQTTSMFDSTTVLAKIIVADTNEKAIIENILAGRAVEVIALKNDTTTEDTTTEGTTEDATATT